MGDGALEIAAIAEEQRGINARRTTAAMAILAFLAVPVSLGSPGAVATHWLLAAAALGLAVAYGLVRAGQITPGVLCAVIVTLFQHVGSVVTNRGVLGPVPYVGPVVILLVAATASSRWLWAALLLNLVALTAEGALSAWTEADRAAIGTAALLAAIVFVISWLHVRGTERAFAVAAAREQERAKAMEAVRETDKLYRLIADNTDDLVALVTDDGKILYLSPSHERLLGLDVAAKLGGGTEELLAPGEHTKVQEAWKETLEAGESRTEVEVPTASGETRRFDMRLTRVQAEDGVVVVLVSRDITERQRLQQRLIASERLEALGRLSGSIAHDFNNLLMVIGGATELARTMFPPDHQALEELDAVSQAANAASRLTRQLLTFSKRQVTIPVELDTRQVLNAQRELLERMVGPSVRLVFELSDGLPPVKMPATHFEQLAMNLVINAREAMPNGGKLTLRLEQDGLEAGQQGASTGGSFVAFAVEDEGIGIPEDVLPRLFEPSFTTKRTGTGLGLATCQSIVSQLGGTIEVRTTVGRGSTFRVLLPAFHRGARAERPPEQTAPIRRLLLVEDEVAVREMTARMLESRGLQVRAAATLSEARRIVGEPHLSIDALVTDVVLSDEQGTDLLSSFRQRYPTAPVVVVSGFSPDPGVATMLEAHGPRFLAKPFSVEQLLDCLAGVGRGP